MRVQRGMRERLWGGVSDSGASRRLVSRERFTLSLAPLKMMIIAIIRTSPVKPGAGVPGPEPPAPGTAGPHAISVGDAR